MKTLEEIIKQLPENIKLPIYEAFQVFQKDIIHRDLSEIKGEIKKVWEAIDKLAEAQKTTEQRVSELAEAQKRTEGRISSLEKTMQELAEAQKTTEQRVSELAEAQKRTEGRVNELASLQKRTEGEIRRIWKAIDKLTESHLKLVKEHRETRRQLGGLSITVGYTLENEAFKSLPKLLKKDYGIQVKGKLKRKFIKDREGKYIEINIIGEGKRNGKKVIIIGESKVQLSKRGIDQFMKRKLNRIKGVYREIFPILVTHMISEPDVEEYAKKKGIALYYSYDF